MNKQGTFIANWKMNLSFSETIEFATTNYDVFVELATRSNQQIVLCPSAESIYPLVQMFKGTSISIGAQTTSSHTSGAFTGQIPPQSIQEVGCTHCIIGHSEIRTEYAETNSAIAQKFIHLLDYDVIPIMCIGESETENTAGKTLTALETQLAPIFEVLSAKTNIHPYLSPCIAYEPIWSIGTGKVSKLDHLDMVLTWLTEQFHQKTPSISWKLLYGGSVTPENSADLKKIDKIDGFLIGNTSLDFQKFKKIVI